MVSDFVAGRLGDCPPKVKNQIMIAVDEIFSNIARYAYDVGIGNATIRVAADDDIIVEFEDSGMAYNPLTADDPDTMLPAEERELGGLGIFMVRKLMDSVEYRREGNKNILTLIKRLYDHGV
jgi:anti-sigma regulatory factor (Ser/Thr protein kinase)